MAISAPRPRSRFAISPMPLPPTRAPPGGVTSTHFHRGDFIAVPTGTYLLRDARISARPGPTPMSPKLQLHTVDI